MRGPSRTHRHWAYGSCRRPTRVAVSCVISASMGLASIPAAAGALGRQAPEGLTLSFDKNSELAQGACPDQPLSARGRSRLEVPAVSLGPHEPRGWTLDSEGTGRLIGQGALLHGTSLWNDANSDGKVGEGELEDLLPHARDGVVTLYAQWPEEALREAAEAGDSLEVEAGATGRDIAQGGAGAGEKADEGIRGLSASSGARATEGDPSPTNVDPPSKTDDGAARGRQEDAKERLLPDAGEGPTASAKEGPTSVPNEGPAPEAKEGQTPDPKEGPAPDAKATSAAGKTSLCASATSEGDGGEARGEGSGATEGLEAQVDGSTPEGTVQDELTPVALSYQRLAAGMESVREVYTPIDGSYVYPRLSFRGYFSNPDERKGGWTDWSCAKTDNSLTDLPSDAGRVLGGRIHLGALSGLQIRWLGGTDSAGAVSYRLLYSDGSHSGWAKNGETAGQDVVTGRKAIGFAVRLEGEALRHYRVRYRMHPLGSSEQSRTVDEGDVSHQGKYADGIVVYLHVQENTVTFVNGEDGKIIKTQKVIYQSNVSEPTPPTIRGRTFLGWEGSYKPVTEDVTVTARYRRNRYSIAFSGNGASSGDTPDVQATYDEPSTLPKSGFRRTGHAFRGWARDPRATKPDFLEGQQVTNLSERDGSTVRLHAIWQRASQRLTVDPMGGTWHKSDSPTTLTQEYGSSTSLERPQRAGYLFRGWKLEGDGSLNGSSYRFGEGDATVRAQWEAIRYSVRFEPNAGDAQGSVDELHATFDEDLQIPGGGFARETFDLVGWNSAPDGNGRPYDLGQTVRNLASRNGERVTLYAQWRPKHIQVRIPVAINYKAKQDGSVHGPADGVVAIRNQSDMGVHVSQISVLSGKGMRIVSADPGEGEVELAMTPEGGRTLRLGDYERRPAAPQHPLEWSMGKGQSLALNGLRGRVSDATLLVRERQVGSINWTVAPGDLRAKGADR